MRTLLCCGWLVAVAMGAAEVTDDFSLGMGLWEPLLANHWQIRSEADNPRLVLVKPGVQRPPLRRPTQFVLLKGEPWWDVTVDASIKTLRPDSVTGRDVCVLFGYRDDTHFYYAHLCSDSNGGTHNVIVKVDGNKRKAILREKKPAPRLTSAWHHARVTHTTDGEIKVYLDDMETPMMTAHDEDYPVGRVGLGAFDDPAMFDDVCVSGQRLDEPVAALEPVEPLADAKLVDSTPRFAWRGTGPVTVEVSATPDFAQVQTAATEGHLLAWPTPLAVGTWHWRLRDAAGTVSEPRSFTQTAPLEQDHQDPRLLVADATLPAQTPLPVALAPGETAAGMYVEATVNGLAATVTASDTGWAVIPPKGWSQGQNPVIIRAVDPAGNAAEFRAVVSGQ